MKRKVTETGEAVHHLREINQEGFLDDLAEYIRGFLTMSFQKAIELELTEFLGYPPYERGVPKNNSRNGYYQRSLVTRFGVLKGMSVARDRRDEFEPKVLKRYQRREDKINHEVMALFIGGISTRRMKKITQMLVGHGYSAGTISNINKQLTADMKAWLTAPIEDDIVYVFLDGLNLPVRRFTVSRESLLMAIGISRDGRRRVLGVQLGDRESASSWGEFLKDLKKRGFKGKHLELGIMDGLPGLEEAFGEAFPRAKIQRCLVHKLRNIAAKLPRSIQKDCLAQCKRIFYAASLEEARKRFQDWKINWSKVAPGAVECLEKDLEVVLSFYLFPKKHWVRIRTTNIIERAFKEFRRRTRAMDSFPNEECCLRCVYALAQQLDERWGKYRIARFINQKELKRLEEKAIA
jgi:putative transposase